MRKPLEDAGYRVEVAKDGQAGIERFHEIEPGAVIIEAMLPKRHGFEVCQELKNTPHGARCAVMIATSVYKGRRYRHQAMHLYSCDAYLEKPITDEDLISTLETSLRDYAEARAAAAQDSAAEMEIDTAPLAEEVPVADRPAGGPPGMPPPVRPDPGATMEIDTSNLAAEVPTDPPTEESAPQASPAEPSDDEFDIVERLDALLSDDPSKSSPTRSEK
ncbi:MAG: response regulator [Acidobacteria bacterium]|nr:response regulator [Acidobacteriota bacterium]NIM62766.1 response regulator [Acidobacteriota bacterium]NIO59066.1 response regulator [Acidobacteriota bacterium]NIQ30105.1 response regulator [Acidobacteriota bacterium]NIQ84908.1 response regulator [Acidobacteriota bacterium]